MNIHCEVHHIGVAEKVQLPLEHFLFIVNLNKSKHASRFNSGADKSNLISQRKLICGGISPTMLLFLPANYFSFCSHI